MKKQMTLALSSLLVFGALAMQPANAFSFKFKKTAKKAPVQAEKVVTPVAKPAVEVKAPEVKVTTPVAKPAVKPAVKSVAKAVPAKKPVAKKAPVKKVVKK